MNETRVNRILAALGQRDISQILIVDPMAIYYLTGVYNEPFERFYGLLLRKDGRHAFFLNRLFRVAEDTGIELVWYDDTDPVTDLIAAHIDAAKVLGVDKDMKVRHLLPLMERGAAAGFVNASFAVDHTRGVKDPEEQEKMRAASAINDQAMARFTGLIHEGVTERQVADQMLEIYIELGADGFSFDPIVSFGANAADPHHMPDDTVVREGDCVLFDVGCKKDGYCSDMTRTFYFRSVSDHCRRLYEIVKAANEAAENMVSPGRELRELDHAARQIIEAEGYGEYFNHRLGHFIGLSEHEYGDVSATNTQKAEPGQIFSIEPGIYLPGDTGVRIEDLVMVTENGVTRLNHFSKELQVIGI